MVRQEPAKLLSPSSNLGVAFFICSFLEFVVGFEIPIFDLFSNITATHENILIKKLVPYEISNIVFFNDTDFASISLNIFTSENTT